MHEIVIAKMHKPAVMVEQLHGTDRSSIIKLNIVNHVCIVTIIGQIKPWGSIENKNYVPHWTYWVSYIIITSTYQIGRCRSMSRDDLWYWQSVNHSSSAHCHIRKSGYTGHDTWKQYCNNSKSTQEFSSNAIFQGILNFIFLSLWVQ